MIDGGEEHEGCNGDVAGDERKCLRCGGRHRRVCMATACGLDALGRAGSGVDGLLAVEDKLRLGREESRAFDASQYVPLTLPSR